MLREFFGMIFGRKQPSAPVKPVAQPEPPEAPAEDYLDDETYIGELHRATTGPWYRYDFQLLARPYGWEIMLAWVDHMVEMDLQRDTRVWRADMGTAETDVTESFHCHASKASETPELRREGLVLSMAGFSTVLEAPVKIVWFNQTQMLRFLTLVNDENKMRRYAETVARLNFGTPGAMKLGRPPEKK